MVRLPIERFCFAACIIFFTSCDPHSAETKSGDSLNAVSIQPDSYSNSEIKRAYSHAIAEYINTVYLADSAIPDTLFIGKHDQFPDIALPYTIQNVPVLLLTNAEYEAKTKYRTHSTFINMIGTQKIAKARTSMGKTTRWEFTMITFFDNANPQYDFHVNLEYDAGSEMFETDTVYVEYPYGKK